MNMTKLLSTLGLRTQRELATEMGLQEPAVSKWNHSARLGDAVKLRIIDFAAERGVPRSDLGLDE